MATEGYSDQALAADNSNYFEIVSANYLGTEQSAQFQSGDQYGAGWHWGSKCTESGGTITCDLSTAPANNALSAMPRMYKRSLNIWGNFYNWYAATAESKAYGVGGYDAEDSICPLGWQLPSVTGANKSWEAFASAYKVKVNGSVDIAETLKVLKSTPLSYMTTGFYYDSGYIDGTTTASNLHSSSPSGSLNASTMYINNSLVGTGGRTRAHGSSIRCIKK